MDVFFHYTHSDHAVQTPYPNEDRTLRTLLNKPCSTFIALHNSKTGVTGQESHEKKNAPHGAVKPLFD